MKTSIINRLIFVLIFLVIHPLFADESTTPTTSLSKNDSVNKSETSSWNELLQNKYKLSDEQMTLLVNSKLPNSQTAMASQLAQSSKKPLEDILKMRLEQKMGWGKIAKELGVPNGELGRAVSSLKKEQNENRKSLKKEKHIEKHDKNHEGDEHHEMHDGENQNQHEREHERQKKDHTERKEKSEHSGKKDK